MDHYRKTLDEPIPALGGQTPRKAVKTAKGRKKVIAWLKMLGERMISAASRGFGGRPTISRGCGENSALATSGGDRIWTGRRQCGRLRRLGQRMANAFPAAGPKFSVAVFGGSLYCTVARIEAVLASAQVAGHIDSDRPNPARWKGWLDHMPPNPRKLGERGHHAAMPYAEVPAFMAKLRASDNTAARALAFTILTAARSGEFLNMTWDVSTSQTRAAGPASRMKMGKDDMAPLSDAALDILRAQEAERGKIDSCLLADRRSR